MHDNDIYALFTNEYEQATLAQAKPTKPTKQEPLGIDKQKDLDSIKPTYDLLLNSANPLRVTWWF